jgi:hypothetical protein
MHERLAARLMRLLLGRDLLGRIGHLRLLRSIARCNEGGCREFRAERRNGKTLSDVDQPHHCSAGSTQMGRIVRDNGLTVVLLAAFFLSLIGQLAAGWAVHTHELVEHGRTAIGIAAYAGSGAFLSAVFENWESEFLQMAAYVVLTAMLFQRGSAESRDPDAPERENDDPERDGRDPAAPWPLRAGPVVRRLYAHSLGIFLGLLFLASFLLHWLNSARAAAEDAQLHGGPQISTLAYLADPQLWFESFQNWQSEFLSTAVLVVLTIFLRQRGSPESKPVAAPTGQTGG